MVRLRDRWVVVDPALVRKARKRQLGLLQPVDALAAALTGTADVDGETVEAVPGRRALAGAARPAAGRTRPRAAPARPRRQRCATTSCAGWPGST